MEKILIAGGAGFIGSSLCERLLNEGKKVICVDNFFTSTRKNVEKLCANPNFELIEHNIQNPIDIEVDQIYNLACPASPVHYQHDAVDTFKTCVLGTLNLLELAKKLNVKFLSASTSEVYGDPVMHPQQECYWGNVNPIGIRSCYDEGKRGAETIVMDYNRQYQVPVKIVRIFNTYGPNMAADDGRVVSNFIVQALQGDDITIYGDGSQTRSFQYVDDLIEGMIRLMATDASFTGPVNIGNPNEFTVLELAQKIIELTGTKSKIIFKALPSDDPQKRNPDITLARKMLDCWTPKIQLQEGLTKTIDYFRTVI